VLKLDHLKSDLELLPNQHRAIMGHSCIRYNAVSGL
jgi:hypothetical protein